MIYNYKNLTIPGHHLNCIHNKPNPMGNIVMIIQNFFTLSDSNTYTPRSILIDMEPSVIAKSTSALPMFNPRNVHLSNQGMVLQIIG